MRAQSLIASHKADERSPTCRKPQARVEMRLMDQQGGIQGTAAAMDDRRPRQRQVHQTGPLEVQGHLVRNARGTRTELTQQPNIVRRAGGKLFSLSLSKVPSFPGAAVLIPEGQLPCRTDIRVCGQNLLDQRRPG